MPTGQVRFKLTSGKTVGPFRGDYHAEDNYIDVTKASGLPTKLDFEKFHMVTSIEFTPEPSGKTRTWTSWEYFNNGAWAVIRLTKLG